MKLSITGNLHFNFTLQLVTLIVFFCMDSISDDLTLNIIDQEITIQLKPYNVWPPDDRAVITTTDQFPWSCVCKCIIYDRETIIEEFSGVMLRRSARDAFHILTASRGLDKFSSNRHEIEVYPGLSGDYEPFGMAKVTSFTRFNNIDGPIRDLAVLTLDRNLGYYSKSMTLRTFEKPTDYVTRVIGAGYPTHSKNLHVHFGCGLEGFHEFFNYSVDADEGQKGMPIFTYDTVNKQAEIVSIHSGTSNKDSMNWGARMTSDLIQTLHDIMNEDARPFQKPDLQDSGPLFWGIDKTTIFPGQDVELWTSVSNIGTHNAEIYSVTFYAFPHASYAFSNRKRIRIIHRATEPIEIGGTMAPGPLTPYQSHLVKWSGTFPETIPAGDYWVGWHIDSNQNNDEIDEINNYYGFKGKKIHVENEVVDVSPPSNPPPTAPPLNPDAVALHVYPTDGVYLDHPITDMTEEFEFFISFEFMVKNRNIENMQIEILLDNQTKFFQPVSPVASGERRKMTLEPPIPAEKGLHTIEARLHVPQEANDLDLTNNQVSYQFYVVEPREQVVKTHSFGSTESAVDDLSLQWHFDMNHEFYVIPKRRICEYLWDFKIIRFNSHINFEYNLKEGNSSFGYRDTQIVPNYIVDTKEYRIRYSTFTNRVVAIDVNLGFVGRDHKINYYRFRHSKPYIEEDAEGIIYHSIRDIRLFPAFGFDTDTVLESELVDFEPLITPEVKPDAKFEYGPLPVIFDHQTYFDARSSIDTDGLIIDYRWDFGNGVIKKGDFVTHIFDQPGIYPVVLIVTDNDECVDTYIESVRVQGTEFEILDYNPRYREGGDGRVLDHLDNLPHRSRIVADGVTKVLCVFRNFPETLKQIHVSILAWNAQNSGELFSPGFMEHQEKGESITIPITEHEGERIAIVGYQSPDNIGEKNFISEMNYWSLYLFDSDGQFKKTYDLEVVPAPLMIVHGFRSNRWGWDPAFVNRIIDDTHLSRDLVFLADYSKIASNSFTQNFSFVKQQINNYLNTLRRRGTAVTQIDYCCHSMGGLIGRSMIQEPYYRNYTNEYKGSIHKFITIGTPHLGSWMADYGVALIEQYENTMPEWLKQILAPIMNQFPIKGIHDLSVQSAAIQNLRETDVPSHAIVGQCISLEIVKRVHESIQQLKNQWDQAHNLLKLFFTLYRIYKIKEEIILEIFEDILGQMYEKITGIEAGKEMLKGICRDLLISNVADFIFNLHGQPNDLVVDEESQIGGLTHPEFTVIPSTTHIAIPEAGDRTFYGEMDSPYVAQTVAELLNLPPTHEKFHVGFPAVQTILHKLPPWMTSLAAHPQNKITSRQLDHAKLHDPVNAEYTLKVTPQSSFPGDLLDISIETTMSGNIDEVIIFVFGNMIELTESPYTLQLEIPTNYDLEVLHIGAWIIEKDEDLVPLTTVIPIDLEKDKTPVRLTVLGVYPNIDHDEMLILEPIEEIPIFLIVYYDDGSTRTLADNFTLRIENESIVDNVEQTLYLKANGSTKISIEYKGLNYEFILKIKNMEVDIKDWKLIKN